MVSGEQLLDHQSLESDTFVEFSTGPALLLELLVIDEVQKLPLLPDEVHWLIERWAHGL